MPELPEVEAARRLLHLHCTGKRIVKVVAPVDEKVIEGITSEALIKNLTGQTVSAACRKGKHMWLEFGTGKPSLLLHFGMTGSIMVKTPKGDFITAKYERLKADTSGTWPPKYCKLDLELSDELPAEPISRLAPDALTQLPSLADFKAGMRALSRKKALRVKQLLMDQECLVSGVGNWVADEVLYQARVHPEQPVLSMSDEQVEAVHSSLQSVLQHAVSVDADSQRFPLDWLFHYRWTGKKASAINGSPIHFVTVGSRTSAYVPSVQKVTGAIPVLDAKDVDPAVQEGGKAPAKKRGRKSTEVKKEEEEEGQEEGRGEEKELPAAAADVSTKPAVKKRGKKSVEVQEGTKEEGVPVAVAGVADVAAAKPVARKRGRKSSEVQEEEVEEQGEGPAAAAAAAKPAGRKKPKKSTDILEEKGSSAAAAAAAAAGIAAAVTANQAGKKRARKGTSAEAEECAPKEGPVDEVAEEVKPPAKKRAKKGTAAGKKQGASGAAAAAAAGEAAVAVKKLPAKRGRKGPGAEDTQAASPTEQPVKKQRKA